MQGLTKGMKLCIVYLENLELEGRITLCSIQMGNQCLFGGVTIKMKVNTHKKGEVT